MVSSELYQAYLAYAAELANANRGIQFKRLLPEAEFMAIARRLQHTVAGRDLLDRIQLGFEAGCDETRRRLEDAAGMSIHETTRPHAA